MSVILHLASHVKIKRRFDAFRRSQNETSDASRRVVLEFLPKTHLDVSDVSF